MTNLTGAERAHYVQQMFSAHVSRRDNFARQLWLVFVFNFWWRHNG